MQNTFRLLHKLEDVGEAEASGYKYYSYVNGRMATLSPTKPAVPLIKGF